MTRQKRLLVLMAGIGVGLATPIAQGQTAPVTITHAPDPQRPGVHFGYQDARGCVERVREPAAEWSSRAPAILWTGACNAGIRDGVGDFKLYNGRLLLVAATGRYADGFRIGPWRWEYPDGRKLEARFVGDAREPTERIVETAKGERRLQRLIGGTFQEESGIAPNPEPRTMPAPAGGESSKPVLIRNEAASYAAAHSRVASCAGKGGIDPRTDLLATRRDVDRFVRDGEAVVREELANDLASWSRAQFALTVHAVAYAASPPAASEDLRSQIQAMQDRTRWAQCHQKNGLPYLARMQQAVFACERASLFKIESVRASDNSRLQAEFADCLHADIHSARWAR